MIIFRCVLLFVFSLIFLNLTGCAYVTREVTLRNSEITPLETATSQKVHTICFNGLEDIRPDSTIGHVQSYNVPTAHVIAVNSVPDWVNTEIKNQLKTAGYDVRKGCRSDGSEFTIDGSILKVYTTMYRYFLGEVSFKASLKVNNTTILEKVYAEHEKSSAGFINAESFRDVLERSLTNAVSKLIYDIDSLDKTVDQNHLQIFSYRSDDGSADDNTLPELVLPDTLNIICPSGNGDVEIISGEYSPENISSSLYSIKANLKKLYKQRFELDSSLDGSICVYFEINRDGKAENIKFIENTLNDNPINERLISKLSEKRFQQPSSEQSRVAITYRIIFSRKEVKSSKAALAAVGVIALIASLILSMSNLLRASQY